MNLAGPYWASTTTILVTKQAVATKSMVRQDLSVDVEYIPLWLLAATIPLT